MKVEVNATNVAEFKPIVIQLSVTIDNIGELSELSEDIIMFANDEGLSDSSGVSYSETLNKIVSSILNNVVKPVPKEEAKPQ